MTGQIRHMGHERRTEFVIGAFHACINGGIGLADVTFIRKYSEADPITTRYALVGIGWNPTYAGPAEALIVKNPDQRSYSLEFIPYTRLVSIVDVPPAATP